MCGVVVVWSMSYSIHGVVDVWCGGCLVWWMSSVVNVAVIKHSTKNDQISVMYYVIVQNKNLVELKLKKLKLCHYLNL